MGSMAAEQEASCSGRAPALVAHVAPGTLAPGSEVHTWGCRQQSSCCCPGSASSRMMFSGFLSSATLVRSNKARVTPSKNCFPGLVGTQEVTNRSLLAVCPRLLVPLFLRLPSLLGRKSCRAAVQWGCGPGLRPPAVPCLDVRWCLQPSTPLALTPQNLLCGLPRGTAFQAINSAAN